MKQLINKQIQIIKHEIFYNNFGAICESDELQVPWRTEEPK